MFSPHSYSNPADLLGIPLNIPYSLTEWNAIFEALIGLLGHQDDWIWRRAIDKLIEALSIEASQRSNCDDYQPRPTDQRLQAIFEAIATQAQNQPDIFEVFCTRFQFLAQETPYTPLVLAWLDQLATSEARQTPTQTAILAAQIFLGVYDSTWQEVGSTLLAMLNHTDLRVRACAAYQIGKFYKKAIDNRDRDSRLIDNVIIGYRSEFPWNPKQFLPQQ